MKKVAIIVCVAICVVLLGGILISGFLGNTKLPFLVPKADRSEVGEVKTISFSRLHEEGRNLLIYIFDPTEKTGRLAAIGDADGGTKVCPIVIYEPEWEGAAGLCGAVDGVFEARIIDIVNIDYYESQLFRDSIYMGDPAVQEAYDPEEILDLADCTLPDGDLQYFLVWLSDEEQEAPWTAVGDAYSICLVGNGSEGCSEKFADFIERLEKIASRYGFRQELGL